MVPFPPRPIVPSPSSSPHNSIKSVPHGNDNANILLGYGDNNANDITDVYGQAESTAAFASANPEESTTHTSVKVVLWQVKFCRSLATVLNFLYLIHRQLIKRRTRVL